MRKYRYFVEFYAIIYKRKGFIYMFSKKINQKKKCKVSNFSTALCSFGFQDFVIVQQLVGQLKDFLNKTGTISLYSRDWTGKILLSQGTLSKGLLIAVASACLPGCCFFLLQDFST
jgi:hypothetical protein